LFIAYSIIGPHVNNNNNNNNNNNILGRVLIRQHEATGSNNSFITRFGSKMDPTSNFQLYIAFVGLIMDYGLNYFLQVHSAAAPFTSHRDAHNYAEPKPFS
jgi:hypothetical protein